MEEPVLRNPEEYPTDDVLRRHLGRAMASWQALMSFVAEYETALSGETELKVIDRTNDMKGETGGAELAVRWCNWPNAVARG